MCYYSSTDAPSLSPSFTNQPSISSQPSSSIPYDWDAIGDKLLGTPGGFEYGLNVKLSGDGKTLAAIQPLEDRIDVYDYKYGYWIKRISPINVIENSMDGGAEIDMSNDGAVIAIGGRHWANRTGAVQVWKWDNEAWTQLGATMYGYRQKDEFGVSVALSGDGLDMIIGSRDEITNKNRGSARVYHFDGDVWFQRGYTISGYYEGDFLAGRDETVAMTDDGNIIAIGAYGRRLVRVLSWDGSDWVRFGDDILRPDEYTFGSSVEISSGKDGNLVLAVASPKAEPKEDNIRGLIRIFEWNGSNWSERRGSPVQVQPSTVFGYTLALSDDGNTFMAPSDTAAYVFDWNGNEWKPRNESPVLQVGGDPQGIPIMTAIMVDMSGDGNTIAIGMPEDDDSFWYGDNEGYVKSFKWTAAVN